MRKQASVDWTVGKLLNIILAMVVLALVIYGISTQSLNPLWEDISGKFDEVKILSPWGDDVASMKCHEENVANLGGGKVFLKLIGMEGKEVILNVCKNRICDISGEGLGAYRTNKGKFEKLENESWKDYNSLITGGIGSVKFNWELYNASVDILEKAGVKDLYNKGFTKKFVLYGDGSGMNREIFAVWQNGYWRVSERGQIPDGGDWIKDGEEWALDRESIGGGKRTTRVKLLYNGTDDGEAIDAFVEKVKGGDDDKVYWSVLKSGEVYDKNIDIGNKIGTLVGDEKLFGIFGSFGELDDDREVDKLKSEFAKGREKYLSETRDSVKKAGGVAKLKKSLGEQEIKINDETFEAGIEEEGDFPIITFSSDEKKFGLKHSVYANVNSDFIKGAVLRDFPVILVERDGSAWKERGSEEYYRLHEKDFTEVYRATLISQLLKSRCK